MNREEAPGKSPEDMYIQQKVRVLLMLKKMGSNVSNGCLLPCQAKVQFVFSINKHISTPPTKKRDDAFHSCVFLFTRQLSGPDYRLDQT